ncbi:Transcription factor spt8 [Saxophila tyrrhenica]|uniref:Transcription factor spt8 n=1 Tax=Saxophila tyrrhenica TaxID=1690608 RepID=A0AAV9PC01_9PEZI|nr:Transcription factor spt8 [Saxophila tyrrhenica]
MATLDDDADAAVNSQDEFENEDEEMEDANDADQDQDQGQDDEGGEDDEDEDNDDGEGEDDDDEDRTEQSPSQRIGQTQRSSTMDSQQNPEVVLTSPSPRRSPYSSNGPSTFIPPTRPEALIAQAYDIVPTMAAPQSTSINAVTATPDMRWVFSGGSDGYVRMYNWVETANGKVPLTVAQKHPFVDSVMKAGSLVTYWENEESPVRTPPSQSDESKWTSPVYSLAVQHQAVWLLSGLESGGINLQTCRHQAGTKITTMKEHTNAVSVLSLSQDEASFLSGSWDKNIHDWDLQTGKVKRSFLGSGGQISAIEPRPLSDVPIPEVTEPTHESLDTFSSNNADRPLTNGLSNGMDMRGGEEDAAGSPSSLFGDDHNSLFGDDTAGVGGGPTFDDADDELTRALQDGLEESGPPQLPAEDDIDMAGMGSGGPVQAPEAVQPPTTMDADADAPLADTTSEQLPNGQPDNAPTANGESAHEPASPAAANAEPNGISSLPHGEEPLTAPATNESKSTDLPPQSGSTFLDASFDGSIRIWDRRVPSPIATIAPYGGTPPWCTGACWSPDGNSFYAGRRNNTVDEYSIHKLGSDRGKPERVFRFQQGSGAVYAVRSMPNGRHLVCASQDILRIYDLQQSEASRHRTVPFTIIPGHRGGVISSVYVDPTCRFMLSTAGNRGWESTAGTEVLLGYEIGVQDAAGVWHK